MGSKKGFAAVSESTFHRLWRRSVFASLSTIRRTIAFGRSSDVGQPAVGACDILVKLPHMRLLQLSLFFIVGSVCASAQTGMCPRYAPGSEVVAPPDLYSKNGTLAVNFSYQTQVGSDGRTRYCFVTPQGLVSPTLHVYPGDRLTINLINSLPPSSEPMPGMVMSGPACGPATMMDSTSVNIHYHGANVSPTCHQDETINTLVNSGETFKYDVHFPTDEPPGLYWYHPHVHGRSEVAVQGGATGAIVVEGIEKVNHAVAGLPHRVLIVRDTPVTNFGSNSPEWDLSLNYTPVLYPNYFGPTISVKPGEKQLWRVLNSSADTILDLQVLYDGIPQSLAIVALDGVPTGSQDGTGQGTTITQTDILMSPATRAEFIIVGPSSSVQSATLSTLAVDTGPAGDLDPARRIAKIVATSDAPSLPKLPMVTGAPAPARFANLASAKPTAERSLYFSELFLGDKHPEGLKGQDAVVAFYVTVQGQTPTVFSATNPPAIVTTQGSVEDWTIENQSTENHAFHIHQIHFLVLEVNGKPVPNGQYLDTIQIPYWTGTGPYPSVKLRMDFRGNTVGDFVYHCHILEHEDGGMMATIRVLASPTQGTK